MDEQALRQMGFDRGMIRTLARFWWVLLLRGLAAVVFGALAIIWPDLTLFVLVILFGAYTVVDGVLEIWSGIQSRNVHDRWWVDILIGIAGIVAGVLVMALPGLSALALMYFIAAWMVVTGVLEIVYAIRLREQIRNEWLLALAGVLSVLLGIYFFLFPGSGAVSLVWVIGVYAILFGVLLVMFAFRARRMGDS
jgi:uncharacterized membrane protein HdeD (DUF308 family)